MTVSYLSVWKNNERLFEQIHIEYLIGHRTFIRIGYTVHHVHIPKGGEEGQESLVTILIWSGSRWYVWSREVSNVGWRGLSWCGVEVSLMSAGGDEWVWSRGISNVGWRGLSGCGVEVSPMSAGGGRVGVE